MKQPSKAEANNDMLARIGRGDTEAREELVRRNRGLIYHAAKKAGTGLPWDDRLAEAHLAFLGAIDTFNSAHGAAFSTWALLKMCRDINRAALKELNWQKHHYVTANPTVVDTSFIEWQESREAWNDKPPEETLARLSELERTVIEMHFGLAGYDKSSFTEIGKAIGFTRQYANLVCMDALQKLREMLEGE